MSSLRQMMSGRVDSERTLISEPLLIFCEGKTEFNYLLYFCSLLHRCNMNTLVVNLYFSHGSGCKVVSDAENFFSEGNNAAESKRYKTYLMFDCDRSDSDKAIESAKNSCYNYTLLLNNRAIETWLCMHFHKFKCGDLLSTKQAIDLLCQALRLSDLTKYDSMKAKGGLVRAVLKNGDIELAIENSKNSCSSGSIPSFIGNNKNLVYSSWYLLFEQLWTIVRELLTDSAFQSGKFISLNEIDYDKCREECVQVNPINIEDFIRYSTVADDIDETPTYNDVLETSYFT